MMKRFFAAALALGLAATSLPSTAMARDWRHGYSHYHRGDAAAAGVIGLAFGAILGAAIADGGHRRYYDRGYYDRGYYDRGYSGGCYDRCGYGRSYYGDGYYEGDDYGYGPSLCVVRQRRFDRYSGREIFIEERRPC